MIQLIVLMLQHKVNLEYMVLILILQIIQQQVEVILELTLELMGRT